MRRFRIEMGGLPDLPGMMLASLDALRKLGGSATIQELDEAVTEMEGVSELEQSLTMSETDARTRLNYYLAWARTYLRRGDAVENSSRGVWAITDYGETLHSIEKMRSFYSVVQEEERERAKQKRLARKANGTELDLKDEEYQEPGATAQRHGADWRLRLLSVLGSMNPSSFERLAQRLLREAGFIKVEVRGQTGDGGIDGVGVLRVNLVSFQVFFQCKRWKSSVGASEIRDFRGAMQGRADKGLFIATSTFTAQARDEATRDGATAIDLIDGERLCDLLKMYELGVSTRTVEVVDIDSTWFDNV